MYYRGLIDTHAHYDDDRFAENLDAILQTQYEHGVHAIISCASNLDTSYRNVELASAYDFVYATVGIHPSDAETVPDDWLDQLRFLSQNINVVAIGEIGLDYHYKDVPREIQCSVFSQQLALAAELHMPVQIHDRESHQDVFDMVKKYRPTGCLHRCSVSSEMAKEYVKLGLYLGIGGALTYDNMKKERAVVKEIAIDHLLLETDCPYLTPIQYKGKISTSDMLWTVAELISQLKGDISPQEVVDITAHNAKKVFGL